VPAELLETIQAVRPAVLVSLLSKQINLLDLHQLVLVAVTSLINQLNKVLNIFSNKEEF
jgi:hypothetical protein